MGFPVLALRTVLMVACLVFVLNSNDRPAQAAVCHDDIWEDGEFCGRDAYVVTGEAEMNHDCLVDMLDFSLFAQEFGLTGSNLSGDFNADSNVDLFDFYIFRLTYGDSVSPCTVSGMLPDLSEGMIALSFSSNPNTIISTQSQPPGPDQDPRRVYVVIDGWTDAEVLEYGIEASSNIEIVEHDAEYSYWDQSIVVWCDPDPEHSYRLFVRWGETWPTGPITFAYVDYKFQDSNPGWLKLVPVPPSCFGSSRLRWAEAAANRSYDFASVLNAEITVAVPTLSQWGRIAFGTVLLTAMAWALRRKQVA